MPHAPEPTTRRELRLAEQAAQHRHAVPRLVRVPRPRLFGLLLRPVPLGAAALAAVAVGSAVLGGGTAQVYANGVATAQHERLLASAALETALTTANIARADRASGDRLGAQAVGYAGAKRTEALTAARAAVANAQAVAATAVTDVAVDVLAPLDSAAANLQVLIAQAPADLAATSAVDAAPAATAADPLTDAPASAVEATVDPAADSELAVDGADEPAPEPSAEVAAESPAAEPEAEPTVAENLRLSAEMLAAAQAVSELSVQVQVTAGENAAAVVAEQEAAAELARKIDTAVAADNGEIPADVLCAPSFAPKALLRCDAVPALEELDAAFARKFGRHLSIVSSYRTYDEQVTVKALRGGLAASAGTSNHGLGIAVDFANFGSVGDFTAVSYLWMKDNASEFGWFHPALMEAGGSGPLEPWHWEFDAETNDEDVADS
ncbi:M15 family metallopeptidase [Pengzhenrongella sicca]|uniref:D-alanyl-D-alanine carboxypeptidase family protein n=1 Tax=Pengzhenrongella sicca TaxID=2819238 RepID=A0A8A4ZCN6_9MICO|nr:M15 family metallopeptidase [Pengzhenrongella sicca]QTE29750.1 D-alanyl-D-alanine carboxypeptidase family protein [Pengzhenrongella sicca]